MAEMIGLVRTTDALNRVVLPMEWIAVTGFKTDSQAVCEIEDNVLIVSQNGLYGRKIDSMRRFTLPKPFCMNNGITKDTPIEIQCDGEKFYLRKYEGVYRNVTENA